MSQSYEIAFYGKLIDGFTEETTKQHIAQLFKTTTDQVARMFSGKRVVIRNKLDAETAKKYILAMKKRGAQCQIEEMGMPGVAVDLDAGMSPASFSESNASESTVSESKVSGSGLNQTAVPQTNRTFSSEASTEPSAQVVSRNSSQEVASKSGLNLAGEKADEILATVHLDIDPVGVRLSEESEFEAPDLPGVDSLSIAPVGTDLAESRAETPVMVPDVSHLSLK